MVCVKDSDEAAVICRNLVEKEGVNSITLCPAFTHADVAKVTAVVPKTPVNVCRADGPSLFAIIQPEHTPKPHSHYGRPPCRCDRIPASDGICEIEGPPHCEPSEEVLSISWAGNRPVSTSRGVQPWKYGWSS